MEGKYDKEIKKKEYGQRRDKQKLQKIKEIIKEDDRIDVLYADNPTGIPQKSYDKICKLMKEEDKGKYLALSLGDKNKEEKKKEKKVFDRITNKYNPQVLDEMKNATVSKSIGCLIGFTKFLYGVLILIAIFLCVLFCIHTFNAYFTIARGELCFITLISFCILSGGMGLAKLGKRSKLQFDKICSILLLQILNCGFFLATAFSVVFSGDHMKNFCRDYRIYIYVISAVIASISFVLIILNNVIENFYHEYYLKKKELNLI